ncbi:MAG: 1-acyl-sn-glycerol-3-phosphate acyltransferase [Butyrivibrio sp.]|nr:1-acyl-sn-glycerol-3-phosphate acyltransferase [Butyrivibrio sp.]
MIRIILALLFVILFLIVSIPIQLILLIYSKFGEQQEDAARTASLRIVGWAFNVVKFISGIKLTVIGEENVPRDEAVLYVGNHRSIFDIVLTYPRVPHRTGFIAKQETKKIPVLGTWMVYMDCLFLDRKDIRKGLEMVLNAIEKVKKGVSIAIYPEGTRNKTDAPLLDFHKGSFKIAQKSGCAIVPVVMNHTRDILEAHMPFIHATKVVLEYGKPIYMKDLPKEDQKNIDTYVKNIIEEIYLRNETL